MQSTQSSRFSLDRLRSSGVDVHAYIDALTPAEADALLYDWTFLARPRQLAPPDPWAYWLYLAGRGAGKTRTGAEWVRQCVKQGMRRVGLIAPTAADVRDVMVEGESGLLEVCWEHDRTDKGRHMGKPVFEPTKRRVTWANGAQCALYSADQPERLRGPQHEALWADELCSWRRPEAWSLAQFGLRLGKNPQAFISTTPKPTKILLDLVDNEHCIISNETTYANRANLAAQFFETIIREYEGTRLGEQELNATILEQAENALWTSEILDETRRRRAPDDLNFIAVAIDPPAKSDAAEAGITVTARGYDGHGYVLDDVSRRGTPREWARAAIRAYHKHDADVIVAEINNGGEMVEHTIHSEDSSVPVRTVHASRGKRTRAEPISLRYEKGTCHMVGHFPELESQMVIWEPGEDSPDRMDSVVWGLTACLIGFGPIEQIPAKGMY